jgi:putative membrane-bound dehydrogenase-like protein
MRKLAPAIPVALLFLSLGAARSQPPSEPRHPESLPLAPELSLKRLHVRAGYQAELVAAEPLVVDPVAFDWGPDGALWVVEMRDYPLGMDGRWQPGGRVKRLTDADGDGTFDKATVFLDGLSLPNGILPWRSGVLVTAAPEIFYAEDSDGDGKADRRETLYRGFKPGNPQLRINGLRYGLDNWVYCANGWSGGVVESVKTGEKLDIGGRDVRIRPDTGELEAASGVSQFGRNRDDWDNWFAENNSNPLWHYVLADHDARRNPHIPPPDPIVQLVTPPNPKVFPAKPPEKRYHPLEQSGHYTSACSAMVYRDRFLFGDLAGVQHAFTCEPFHNLVQHHVLVEEGATFRARRDPADAQTDFFASEDRWCRPVMVRTGPDGALWIADMYRYVIEHPEYLTPDGKKELAPYYRLGDDRGRLYRLNPRGKRPRSIPRLDAATTEQLVSALHSPSGWERDMAQMLLIWRGDVAAIEPLEALAEGTKRPLARLHALATLDGMDRLRPQVVLAALASEHPGVRRHAVRLAAARGADNPSVAAGVQRLAATETDAKVRMQLAATLGRWRDAESAALLARLAASPQDRHVAAAVACALTRDNVAAVLCAVLDRASRRSGQEGASDVERWPRELLVPILATAAATGEFAALGRAVDAAAPKPEERAAAWRFRGLADVLDALARFKVAPARLPRVATADASPSEQIALAFDRARTVAADEQEAVPERVAAVELLGRARAGQDDDAVRVAELLAPRTPAEVQLAAVAAIARLGRPHAPGLLLGGWKGHSPAVRAEILDALLSRGPWTEALLAALQDRTLAPADFDAARRQRLATHRDKSIRERATQLLGGPTDPDRGKVVAQYIAALEKLSADPVRGAVVFQQHCASCHRFRNQGVPVGPDLESLTDKSPRALLTAILDPNQAVEPRFLSYAVLTRDGRNITGILAVESSASVTIVAQDGKKHEIPRGDIDQLQGTGKSLMPEGVEKELSPQDAADVMAHVRAAR